MPAGGAHAQRPAPGRQRSSATDARQFIQDAERRLEELGIKLNRAAWVGSNFITDDTEALSADAEEEYNVAVQQLATAARRFDGVKLPADQRRTLTRLRLLLAAPPPGIPAEATELTRLTTSMQADYGKGTYCRKQKECLQINDLSRILAESRDPAELLDAWQGWHRVGAPLRKPYTRFVELSNKGARGLGASDLGALWRSGYDMPPEAFAEEVERLWGQVRPLYLSLHAYVRSRLTEKYGPELVPPGGMIPAHLLGNMWAQEWGNIYDVVAPRGVAAQGYDLTELLRARKVDQLRMVRYGERFFTSLGLPALPATFWERSLIVKPRDREVVCHASAWNIDDEEDVRIKMCTEVSGEDFVTVHHELGHNYYSLAYKDQPYLFKSGAHDGFHEAVGDAIALAITPEYLRTVRLLDRVPTEASDTALLLRQAMDKVAFLPFGLLIDQWRWKVFSGEIKPAEYNASWWKLRNSYQGVSAPLPRTEADFDPGAKFHVPGNTPYTRYFLARILQFQFYRALCREAGYKGPMHRCSFFGSKEAGHKLEAMLAMGASRPWPEVLHAMTGEREMDAGAMVEYFAPLAAWLDRQNRGRQLGWTDRRPAKRR
ncbi:MAG: M2 family metallopeptidase [Gemmatimonadales bacterium]|nr:M2 family metallopeptidase [Gemmatimonadales bacterium]